MENFVFYSPTKFIFGINEEENVGKYIKEFGGSKILLHYGTSSAKKSGLIDKIQRSLEKENLSYIELGGVEANPKSSLVYRGIETAKKEKVEEKAWKSGDLDQAAEVDEELVAEVLAMSTGIPVVKLTEAESAKLLNMESELHKRIIGQDKAIAALSKSIRRTRAGLKDPKRPGGSFIFAGPTGVGKTELAKALADFLFDDERAMVRIDMSEYSEKHAVARLVGAPPSFKFLLSHFTKVLLIYFFALSPITFSEIA